MKNFSPVAVLLITLVFGCGDNLQTTAPVVTFGPPTALKAFSRDQSSVLLKWAAAPGSTDSTFRGYIIQAGIRRDTLAKENLAFTATALPAGESTFLISSLKTNGTYSDAATIRWAPAARFDSAYLLFETNTLVSSRKEGFNVGTATTNPSTMVIDLTDPVVQQTMDFYVNGGTQQIQQPLALWSAHLFFGNLNRTFFSTQTDASPTLDYPLSAFPLDITFTKDSIAIVDNTIYYAKVIGDPQEVNYVRIHVHVRPGTSFPDRVVEIRISLQRVPGLLFASMPEHILWSNGHGDRLCLFIRYNHKGVT